jgi:saccharopine dehydrogenase-like NADP-dependent oxidoreductase
MRIALLGAGRVGQMIAKLLAESGDYDVTMIDENEDSLTAAVPAGVRTVLQEITVSSVADQIRGCDALVNALPFHLAPTVATAAAASDCNYLDLTEDTAATRHIKELAETATKAFVPQCGLAPGYIGIAARKLISNFDDVHDVKMRVGALPVFPTNSLKYNLTWSVEGLINEYCHACEGILDGARVELRPLEGLEHMSLDGIQYEAFNTSGGLGTMCESLLGKVHTLDYKSIRYPGHCALMKLLLEELKLKSDRDTMVRIFRESIPTTDRDVAIIFVSVTGMKHGRFLQDVFARKIFGGSRLGGSAVQVSTASSLCTVLDMLRLGQLPDRGFVRQEDVDFDLFMANRFAGVYRDANLVHLQQFVPDGANDGHMSPESTMTPAWLS